MVEQFHGMQKISGSAPPPAKRSEVTSDMQVLSLGVRWTYGLTWYYKELHRLLLHIFQLLYCGWSGEPQHQFNPASNITTTFSIFLMHCSPPPPPPAISSIWLFPYSDLLFHICHRLSRNLVQWQNNHSSYVMLLMGPSHLLMSAHPEFLNQQWKGEFPFTNPLV